MISTTILIWYEQSNLFGVIYEILKRPQFWSHSCLKEIMPVDIASEVRAEFPALVGDPGRDYIFGDAPTGTQVRCCITITILIANFLYRFATLLIVAILKYLGSSICYWCHGHISAATRSSYVWHSPWRTEYNWYCCQRASTCCSILQLCSGGGK